MSSPKKEDLTPLLICFGQRLRTLRQAKGCSQEQFAALIGLDRTYYAGVERGLRNPSLRNLVKIAQGFNLSLEALFHDVRGER